MNATPDILASFKTFLEEQKHAKMDPVHAEADENVLNRVYDTYVKPDTVLNARGTMQKANPFSDRQTYVVQTGDTWTSIAARFNTMPEELIIANPHVSPRTLSVGDLLIVPKPYTYEDFVTSIVIPDQRGLADAAYSGLVQAGEGAASTGDGTVKGAIDEKVKGAWSGFLDRLKGIRYVGGGLSKAAGGLAKVGAYAPAALQLGAGVRSLMNKDVAGGVAAIGSGLATGWDVYKRGPSATNTLLSALPLAGGMYGAAGTAMGQAAQAMLKSGLSAKYDPNSKWQTAKNVVGNARFAPILAAAASQYGVPYFASGLGANTEAVLRGVPIAASGAYEYMRGRGDENTIPMYMNMLMGAYGAGYRPTDFGVQSAYDRAVSFPRDAASSAYGYMSDKLGRGYGYLGDTMGYVGDKLGRGWDYASDIPRAFYNSLYDAQAAGAVPVSVPSSMPNNATMGVQDFPVNGEEAMNRLMEENIMRLARSMANGAWPRVG